MPLAVDPLVVGGGGGRLWLRRRLFFPFFFFFFFKPAPPGFSLRWASCMSFVAVVDLNSGVSVTDVEPAAWADSDKATRPAAARSAVRMNVMIETSMVDSAETKYPTLLNMN